MRKSSYLLAHAESILCPDIFSHPVWIRFGRKETATATQIIEDLLPLAKTYQDSDPECTRQVLFICAVYQSQAGQYENALKTLQKIQSLLQHAAHTNVMVWIKWAVCSITFQQGKYEQTIRHLDELQAILHQEKEWILADYIDVICEALRSPQGFPNYSDTSKNDLSLANGQAISLDCLNYWGIPDHAAENDPLHQPSNNNGHHIKVKLNQFHLSSERWQNYWHNLLLLLGGKNNGHQTKLNEECITKIHLPAEKHQSFIPTISTSPKSSHRTGGIPESALSRNSVVVQMLGPFNIAIQDRPVKIPASRGLSILKYLLLHHKQATPRDVLLDVFWPESEPDAARNNLNVAMHGLRHTLRTATDESIVCFNDGAYGISPTVDLWLDVEEFEHCIKEGKRLDAQGHIETALVEYEIAVNLYRGDFLVDHPYENWAIVDRERLRITYLDSLDRLSQTYFTQENFTACITVCQLILSRDRCREDTYCLLMRSYSRQGLDHLALRQYQNCAEALRAELEVEPSPETTKIYNRIRRHELV